MILPASHNPPHSPFPAPARPHPHTRTTTTRSGLYLRPIYEVSRGLVIGIARNHAPSLAFDQNRDKFLRSVCIPSFSPSVRSISPYKIPIPPLRRTCSLRIAPDLTQPHNHPPPAISSPPDLSRARTTPKGIPKPLPVVTKCSPSSISQPLCETVDVEPRDRPVLPPAERTDYREVPPPPCPISLYSGRSMVSLTFIWHSSSFLALDHCDKVGSTLSENSIHILTTILKRNPPQPGNLLFSLPTNVGVR